jgi:hypothetical protein
LKASTLWSQFIMSGSRPLPDRAFCLGSNLLSRTYFDVNARAFFAGVTLESALLADELPPLQALLSFRPTAPY